MNSKFLNTLLDEEEQIIYPVGRRYYFIYIFFVAPIIFFCLYLSFNVMLLAILGFIFTVLSCMEFFKELNTNYVLTNKNIIKISFKKVIKKSVQDIESYSMVSDYSSLSSSINTIFNKYFYGKLSIKFNSNEEFLIPEFFKISRLEEELESLLTGGNKKTDEKPFKNIEILLLSAPFLIFILFLLILFSFNF